MRTLHVTTTIHAPIARVFALSSNTELVRQTLGMRLIDGPASIQQNSRVHWRGWKFGLPTSHHTLITAYEPPHPDAYHTHRAFFQDTQERGRFARFHHDHHFTQEEGSDTTTVEDHIYFSLPLWLGGPLTERLLLAPHIRRLARQRFALLKRLAESDEWQRYIPTRTPAA